jgi:hypothetical protein
MKKIILIAVFMVFMAYMSYAETYQYSGRLWCKVCHCGIRKDYVYEKWKKSPHGHAFTALKAIGQEKNPQCLPCHTTGYGAGGYKIEDPYNYDFEGVGCEACHGPGSGYRLMSIMKDKKRSLANGLIIPTEAVCKKCHNEKNQSNKVFNYQEARVKINHNYRKK